MSYPPAHDCRPSCTAPGQRVEAISTAVGGKACHDGSSGTPFALTFPLIARHDRGKFTLLSMRAVETPQGRLSLVDDPLGTESLTTTPDDGQMDCSDDSAVTGGRPTEGGGVSAHPHVIVMNLSLSDSVSTQLSVGRWMTGASIPPSIHNYQLTPHPWRYHRNGSTFFTLWRRYHGDMIIRARAQPLQLYRGVSRSLNALISHESMPSKWISTQ